MALNAASWSIVEAAERVQPKPGLYAIHSDEVTWIELGLEHRPRIPLYVGKSESSLVGRELGQHFAINPETLAQTGSSTVRRSFAALLRAPLELRGVPRNKANPGYFANYGLEPDGDLRLTAWMHRHLRLSVWEKPTGLTLTELGDVEVCVIKLWTPPLNIQDNPGRLPLLRAARSAMALAAKSWA